MKSPLRISFLTLASALALPAQDLISFEPDANGYLPDGTLATDELHITTQFKAQFGVTFGTDNNGDLSLDPGSYAVLEKAGNSDSGWGFVSTNSSAKQDSGAPGYEDQLGDWFLKSRGNSAGSTFLITYDNPVTAASAELWDIDARKNGNYEQWAIKAYDSGGTLLATIESPTGIHHNQEGSLDSKPWIWSFDFSGQNGAEISAITMENIGLTNGPVGFNNFAASSPSLDVESTPATMANPEVSFSILAVSFALLGVGQRGRANA